MARTSVTPRRKPIEPHRTHSQRLMEHAEQQLAKGDRLQASEKAWGAIAHQIKAIANQRGWNYETHQQVYGIVGRLAKETEDPELVNHLFSLANGLHQNYYRDSVPLDRLKYEIGEVKRLLDILNRPELMRPKHQRKGPRDRSFSKRRGTF